MKKLVISVLILAVALSPLAAEAKNRRSDSGSDSGSDSDSDSGSDSGSDSDSARISGGGQGSFADGVIDDWDLNGIDGDIDGDRDVDGSYWGVGVEIGRHSVSGHFVCAMWGNTDIYNLELMGVEGTVETAELSRSRRTRSVTLTGKASVDLGDCVPDPAPDPDPCFFEDVPYVVVLTEGGAGEATIQLTVDGFDGLPGDTEPDNGKLDLPVEQVVSGHIDIR